MKLAEALQERADLNRRISQLEERLINNSLVQEGEDPAEDPQDLLAELDSSATRLERLIAAINLTNSTSTVEGVTLTELIARKDRLGLEIGILREVISAASGAVNRYSRSEIKVVRTVDVAALQKRADALSKELRELDNRLQQANWMIDVDIT